MNQRENFFAMVNGEKPEFVPIFGVFNKFCVAPMDPEAPSLFGGVDGFGVSWTMEKAGSIPTHGQHILGDVTKWREQVSFPDLDKVDFNAMAAVEKADYNPDEQVLYFMSGLLGPYMRLSSLMGLEDALVSLMLEPEACIEFFDALADFEIDHYNRIIDAYQPDVVTISDDVATAASLFMPPETYRAVIKPATARIIKAINDRGVLCDMHCCGKPEAIIDDFVEIGVRIWSQAQPINDIEAIQEKYGSKLIIYGSWDGMGRPGCVDATEKEVCDEAVRCLKTYGKHGNYILWPLMMVEDGGAMGYNPNLAAVMKTYAENCMLA